MQMKEISIYDILKQNCTIDIFHDKLEPTDN